VLLMCMLTYLHDYCYSVMILYCCNVLSWNQSVEENKEIIRIRNQAHNLTWYQSLGCDKLVEVQQQVHTNPRKLD
jgi:hypothetical protein